MNTQSSRQLLSRFLFTFAVVATGLYSQGARADHKGMDFKAFTQQILSVQSHCFANNKECRPEGYEFVTLHSDQGTSDQVSGLLPRFQSIADDQANIWGDTILEGDFDADGQAQIDRIEGVFHNNEIVAFRVTYSEQAWKIGESGERQDAGRITESTYVSLPLSSWFRDNWALASFATR